MRELAGSRRDVVPIPADQETHAMSVTTAGKWTATLIAIGASLALGTSAMAAGTVNVGMSTTMSGAIGSLGTAGRNGVQLAIDKINAEGGLLGDQIKLVTAEDQAKPPIGVTNVRNFILNDKVKAIFGPVSSAVGSAEAGVAKQYKVPIFFHTSNDIDQTGHAFSKYVFQVVPSTYMEPHAIAAYVAKEAKEKGWKTFYTISPDYSFGRTTVEEFLNGMKANGVTPDVVGQQWPALGASDYSQYISAINTKKPDFVFVGQYGGDLVTLTKQGNGAGLFKNSHVYAGYWLDALQALGADAPAGVISSDRAKPFYDNPTAAMKEFTKAYHEKFGSYPAAWAILSYSAVETWAQGVKKAGSFDADKVADALSGATIDSALRGPFKIRECDHLAEVPEYMGVLSQDVNKDYGVRTMDNIVEEPASKTMMSCEAKKKLQG
jgi:branched-chain amino acid transport system substrate-binding protein